MKRKLPIGFQIFLLIVLVFTALRIFAPLMFTATIPALGETNLEKIDLAAPKYTYTFAFMTMLSLFFLGVFAFNRITGQSMKDVVGPRMMTGKKTLYVLGILVVAWFVADGLYLINHEILANYPEYGYLERELEYNEAYATWFNADQMWRMPFALFIFALMPAVVEELIFRGILLNKLRLTSQNNIHFSVIVSALLFTAFHTQAWNILPILGMGVVLGYVYVYTKDIRYSMMVHFLYNGIQIVLMYLAPELML